MLCVGATAPLFAQQKRFAEGLTFVYDQRDAALAERLWPMMQADRAAMMERLGLHPSGVLRVELTPTMAAFRAAQPHPAPDSALGLYYPARRLVLLRAPRTDPGGQWDLRGVMRHELAHGILDLAVERPIPRWLNEGLAILMADELSFLDDSRLTMAAVTGNLLPLERLMRTFPAGEGPRTLAYSQAASFVRLLKDMGDVDGIRRLLAAMAQGVPVPEAFRRVYGLSLPELEARWRKDLVGRFSFATLLGSTTVLGIVGVPLLLLAAVRRKLEQRRALKAWRQDEGDPPRPPATRLRRVGVWRDPRVSWRPPRRLS